MKLPPSNKITKEEYYNKYWISTKTFNPESIEKPDMSRYLVYLTGKGELLKILQGKHSCDTKGFLKSSAPYYDKRSSPCEVVCFTESPIFALDFFRYKSFDRWERNHLYGIGFFKIDLINLGVRPIINADDELNRIINHLFNSLKNGSMDLSCIPYSTLPK